MVHCVHPPFFMPHGQIIAQVILMPNELPVDDSSLDVYWTEVIGENKPWIECGLRRGEDYLHLRGMLDTGADMTLIPTIKWPSHWELQLMIGKVEGIGGTQVIKLCKNVQIEGPDGQLASLHPFVLD